jgi:hypothetical protein
MSSYKSSLSLRQVMKRFYGQRYVPKTLTTKLFTGELSKIFDMKDFIDNSSGDLDFTMHCNHEFFTSYYPDAPMSKLSLDDKGNFKGHFNFVMKMKMSPKD